MQQRTPLWQERIFFSQLSCPQPPKKTQKRARIDGSSDRFLRLVRSLGFPAQAPHSPPEKRTKGLRIDGQRPEKQAPRYKCPLICAPRLLTRLRRAQYVAAAPFSHACGVLNTVAVAAFFASVSPPVRFLIALFPRFSYTYSFAIASNFSYVAP